MWQTHKVYECWENRANGLAWLRVATNLLFVKNTVSVKRHKAKCSKKRYAWIRTGILIVGIVEKCGRDACGSKNHIIIIYGDSNSKNLQLIRGNRQSGKCLSLLKLDTYMVVLLVEKPSTQWEQTNPALPNYILPSLCFPVCQEVAIRKTALQSNGFGKQLKSNKCLFCYCSELWIWVLWVSKELRL